MDTAVETADALCREWIASQQRLINVGTIRRQIQTTSLCGGSNMNVDVGSGVYECGKPDYVSVVPPGLR